MNPCDRMYSVSIDQVSEPTCSKTCELCGALVDGCEHDSMRTKDMIRAMERIYRLSEWLLWCEMSHKAVGSTIRVIAARLINPSASLAQIAAAVGMDKSGVRHVVNRVKENLPHVYRALWGGPGGGTTAGR